MNVTLAAHQWREITDADLLRDDEGLVQPKLLIARYPTSRTWSDPYYGWWMEGTKEWARWPHRFPPTHCMEIDPPADPSPALSREGAER